MKPSRQQFVLRAIFVLVVVGVVWWLGPSRPFLRHLLYAIAHRLSPANAAEVLKAAAWPLVALFAIVVFRRPIHGAFARIEALVIGKNILKFGNFPSTNDEGAELPPENPPPKGGPDGPTRGGSPGKLDASTAAQATVPVPAPTLTPTPTPTPAGRPDADHEATKSVAPLQLSLAEQRQARFAAAVQGNCGNVFWVGTDLMILFDILVRGGNRDMIVHQFGQVDHHIKVLGLNAQPFYARFSQMRAFADASLFESWTPQRRGDFASDVLSIRTQMARVIENAQPGFSGDRAMSAEL